MTAREIIDRARSLADLPNSEFISYSDEKRSINEAYKDIYSALTNNDDDYYLSESIITITAGMKGEDFEYIVPQPTDFYKLRYLDYKDPARGGWEPMRKFPMSMKDYDPSVPYYRLKNDDIWIILSNFITSLPQIRVGYYPPPATITFPDTPLEYGTSYTRALYTLISSPAYAGLNNTGIYAYNSVDLKAESIDSRTVSAPVALFTAAGAVTQIQYYKGSLYWVAGGNVNYKPTELAAAFVAPTVILAAVTSISIFSNTIYYTTAAAIRSCTLTGGSDALVMTVVATSACILDGIVYYTEATSNDFHAVGTVAPLITGGCSKIITDGTYLYLLKTDFILYRLTMSSTPAITANETMYIEVQDIGMGQWANNRIAVLTREWQRFYAISDQIDYEFTYPSNLPTEIMSYQCAIDFRAKHKGDTSELKERLAALWTRFSSTIKRDEYQAERINNAYDHPVMGLR